MKPDINLDSLRSMAAVRRSIYVLEGLRSECEKKGKVEAIEWIDQQLEQLNKHLNKKGK